MAQKRLNKNLVAILTVGGIVLTVAVVAVITRQSARKDPRFWAEKAETEKQAGQLDLAIRYYQRAYAVSKGPTGGRDVSFLEQAADCSLRYGDVRTALSTLERAHAEQPDNARILEAHLDIVWKLFSPERGLPPDLRLTVEDFAESLQTADASNVAGPVSLAIAKWAQVEDRDNVDAPEWAAGDECLKRAQELSATDPRVVRARIEREAYRWRGRAAQMRKDGMRDADIAAAGKAVGDSLVQILAAGVEANPADWQLVERYVGELINQDRRDEARDVLAQALKHNPSDPDLLVGMARILVQDLLRRKDELSPEDFAAQLGQLAKHARDAVTVEPAMYEAWILLAQAELMRDMKTAASVDQIAPARYEAALAVYDEATQKIVGVHSLHALLGESLQQRLLYGRAFQTAWSYGATASGDDRDKALQWLDKLLKAALQRYPADREAFAAYMQGQAAILRGQVAQAIQAFEHAEQLANADTSDRYPRIWFEVFAGALPGERLSLLYRELNQPGESLRYTEQVMQQYTSGSVQRFRGGEPPPLPLAMNRAELLNILDRSQEALDYTGALERGYADGLAANERMRARLAEVKTAALRKLGRGSEVEQVIDKTDLSDSRTLVMQAESAQMDADYPTVIARCRELIARDDTKAGRLTRVLQLLVPALLETQQQDEGRKILADVRKRFELTDQLARTLGQYDILLATQDPAERDAKLHELIDAEPDPLMRAEWYFSFHMSRGDLEKAAQDLDVLEQAKPEDANVMSQQFFLALRTKQYERASKYTASLSRLDADRAGGATYRGQLALSQEKYDEAVRELRAAREMLPRTSALQVALGRALLAASRPAEAVDALEEAVELNPQDFNANKLLYVAYQNVTSDRRPADGGVSYLQKARTLNPNDAFIKEQGEFLDEEADPQGGIAKREQRRAADPNDLGNLTRLAELYVKAGDPAHAAERFQEGVRLAPGDVALARGAADFYASTGRRAEGEQHLRAFLEHHTGKERGYAYVLLANFYERLKDLPAAEAAYEDAKRVIEETVTDSEERRQALVEVGFERIDFYRRSPGRADAMIEACRWVMDRLRPEDAGAVTRKQYARLAIVNGLLASAKSGDAEQEINAYVKDYPDDVNGLIALARLKLARRQWKDAFGTLSDVLQKFPNHTWSLLQRGRLSVRYGRYVEAPGDLLRARKLVEPPEDPAARERWRKGNNFPLYRSACLELAELYEVTQQSELAEAALREVLKWEGDSPESMRVVDQVVDRLTTLFSNNKQYDKAKAIVGEFLARYPGVGSWPYRYALVCADQAEEFRQQAETAAAQGKTADESKQRQLSREQFAMAVDYYKQAEQLAQKESMDAAQQYLAFRLDAQVGAGQAAEAVQFFEQLQQRLPNMKAIVRAAAIGAYSELKRRDDALLQLEKGLEQASRESASVLGSVVRFARNTLSSEDVLAELRKLSERTPLDSPDGLRLRNALAGEAVAANQAADALRVLEAVLSKAAPNSPDQLVAQLVKAQALERANDAAGAVKVLEQVLQAHPTFATAMNNLAYILADAADRPQEALKYAEDAYDQDTRNPTYLDTLGWVYFKNGRFEEAEVTLHQAISLEPEHVAAHYHLGRLYSSRGRSSEARAVLTRALMLAEQQKLTDYQRRIKEARDQVP